jgi:putative methyltransferase
MYRQALRTVLVSEPQIIRPEVQFDSEDAQRPYLPYVWAILKSYWERHGDGDGLYEWLEPIWLNDVPDSLLRPYQGLRLDVLALSCYTWNWEAQCGIAKQIKARNPECLVVAGGPEPDYKDPNFFRKHPYIDMVAVKDGEITFNKILSKVACNNRDFRDIRGLYMPGLNGGGHFCTGAAEVPTVFDHSPYIDQAVYYQRLAERYGTGNFDVIIETNRGCPYSCSFCDWGSNTMSKVRAFEMTRIEDEIDWLGRMKFGCIMLADANFGILPRDLEIADFLNTARQKHDGYPRRIYYSAAKNNPDRAIAIARKFAQSGLCTSHALSIQHTRREVLAATERSNISPEKQVQVVKAMMEARVPIDVQLIVGIPGDTYELWKGCLTDLMEWGIHEDYLVEPYHLLPNAPAAEKAFMDAWQISTVEHREFDPALRELHETSKDAVRRWDKIIVQSKTYSREDWVKISTFAAFVKALHNCGLTQRIAVYLRLTQNLPYSKFYEGLIEDWFQRAGTVPDWYRVVSSHYRGFLEDADTSDHIKVEALPRLPYALHPSRWIYVQACLHIDRFFDALQAYLLAQYPAVANLCSVIDYQKELVILPTFDRDAGKTFRTDLNWVRYFEEARGRDGSEPLGEPLPAPGAVVSVTDRASGDGVTASGGGFFGRPLEWGSGEMQDQWAKWIELLVVGRSSAAIHNFQQLQLEVPNRSKTGEAK